MLSSWPLKVIARVHSVHLMNAAHKRLSTLRPSHLTSAVSPPVGSYRLQPPSPFIIITQPESWYSFTVPHRVVGWVDLGRMCPFCNSSEQRTTKVVVTTGALRRAKLQSNRHHRNTDSQLFTGRMSSCQPTLVTITCKTLVYLACMSIVYTDSVGCFFTSWTELKILFLRSTTVCQQEIH